jgi:hypothetical protein
VSCTASATTSASPQRRRSRAISHGSDARAAPATPHDSARQPLLPALRRSPIRGPLPPLSRQPPKAVPGTGSALSGRWPRCGHGQAREPSGAHNSPPAGISYASRGPGEMPGPQPLTWLVTPQRQPASCGGEW